MPRPTKRSKSVILVFCEGESEQVYTDFLKKNSEMLRQSDGQRLPAFLMRPITNSKRTRSIGKMPK